MLDVNIKAQLQNYFTKIRHSIVLKAALDDSQESNQIEALLKEVSSLSDKITYEIEAPPLCSPAEFHNCIPERSRRHPLCLSSDGA